MSIHEDSVRDQPLDALILSDKNMQHNDVEQVDASPEARLESGLGWVSKVEAVKNDPNLRGMEAEIQGLERLRGR